MKAQRTTRNHRLGITVLTLTTLLVLGLLGAQNAAAHEEEEEVSPLAESMTVSMADFCTHLHVWGGSNTSYPINCAGDPGKPLTLGDFCYHEHYFGTRTTTKPSDSAAGNWCAANSGVPETPVPFHIYCKHLHENASSNTTFPRPKCKESCTSF